MLDNLLQKPEAYRKKIAMLATTVAFLAIFFSWVSYKGIFSENPQLAQTMQQGNTASVEVSTQPAQATNRTGEKAVVESDSAWDILKKQFNSLKESVANVFGPFMGGIEVYENKE